MIAQQGHIYIENPWGLKAACYWVEGRGVVALPVSARGGASALGVSEGSKRWATKSMALMETPWIDALVAAMARLTVMAK